MSKTKIEWADEVWNPVWGCLNHCPYCYARDKIAKRFGKTDEQRAFIPTWVESNFNRKFAKSTKRVFVNSMSDIEYWTEEWMDRVLERIKTKPDIDFIFLTKSGFEAYPNVIPSNCILGVTRDNPNYIGNALTDSRALLNIEPILAPLTDSIAIDSIWLYDWIIIGAETGNRIGRVVPEFWWYEPIIKKAIEYGIPYFIKPSLQAITPSEHYKQQYIREER